MRALSQRQPREQTPQSASTLESRCNKRRARYICVALYFIIMAESYTVGFISVHVRHMAAEYFATEVYLRNSLQLLHLVLLSLVCCAHLLTLPCLCFAAHKHRHTWIIPYLVWRACLTLLVGLMAVYHSYVIHVGHETEQAVPVQDIAVPAALELVVGTLFFAFAFKAYRELAAQPQIV